MRTLIAPTAIAAAFITFGLVAPAGAAELHYKWKKGDTHRFRYEADSTVKVNLPGLGAMMGAAGGGPGMNMKTDTVFSEKVLKVRANGTAEIELTVERLDMYQGANKIASLDKIPARARKLKAEVDTKGRAKFYEMVTVYMKDDQVYVGIHKAEVGPNRASASATAGDHTVEVVASIDPKTGRVEAQMKVTEKKPKLEKVKIKKEDQGVDVLPKEIFEMMVLPDGDFGEGTTTMKTPFGDFTATVTSNEGGKLSFTTKTAMAAKVSEEQAEETAADVDESAGAAGGMPDLGAMMGGLGNMGGGNGRADHDKPVGSSAAMKVDADVTTKFDVKKGRLLDMSGTIGTRMSIGGMGDIDTNTKFTLTRL